MSPSPLSKCPHKAAKSLKTEHACIKLVFSVRAIEAFKQDAARNGLEFGATHQAEGYSFANGKDPDNNSVSISSRAFREV